MIDSAISVEYGQRTVKVGWSFMSSNSRFGADRRRSPGKSARTQRNTAPPALQIAVSADPASSMELMGVRGVLDATTIVQLADALESVADRVWLHLDVTDLKVPGGAILGQFEMLMEQLEYRQVRLRMVGLDPQLPALADSADQG